MKYMAIIDADEKPVSCEFIGCNGNAAPYLLGATTNIKVLEQETQTGHCKNCKWWKDSDGEYRRGIGAESKCPINHREVMEGRGFCFMYEPQERE